VPGLPMCTIERRSTSEYHTSTVTDILQIFFWSAFIHFAGGRCEHVFGTLPTASTESGPQSCRLHAAQIRTRWARFVSLVNYWSSHDSWSFKVLTFETVAALSGPFTLHGFTPDATYAGLPHSSESKAVDRYLSGCARFWRVRCTASHGGSAFGISYGVDLCGGSSRPVLARWALLARCNAVKSAPAVVRPECW